MKIFKTLPPCCHGNNGSFFPHCRTSNHPSDPHDLRGSPGWEGDFLPGADHTGCPLRHCLFCCKPRPAQQSRSQLTCSCCMDHKKHLLPLSPPLYTPLTLLSAPCCTQKSNKASLCSPANQGLVLMLLGCPTPAAVGQSFSLEGATFSVLGTPMVGPAHPHLCNS